MAEILGFQPTFPAPRGTMTDTDPTRDRPGAIRDGDRMCVPIGALTDEEVHAMTTSTIDGGEPYELDDVAEDGTMLNGKRGP